MNSDLPLCPSILTITHFYSLRIVILSFLYSITLFYLVFTLLKRTNYISLDSKVGGGSFPPMFMFGMLASFGVCLAINFSNITSLLCDRGQNSTIEYINIIVRSLLWAIVPGFILTTISFVLYMVIFKNSHEDNDWSSMMKSELKQHIFMTIISIIVIPLTFMLFNE